MSYTLEDEIRDLESKYSDEEIRERVGIAKTSRLTYVSIAESLISQSMIAYNNMIDARIERAIRSCKNA